MLCDQSYSNLEKHQQAQSLAHQTAEPIWQSTVQLATLGIKRPPLVSLGHLNAELKGHHIYRHLLHITTKTLFY